MKSLLSVLLLGSGDLRGAITHSNRKPNHFCHLHSVLQWPWRTAQQHSRTSAFGVLGVEWRAVKVLSKTASKPPTFRVNSLFILYKVIKHFTHKLSSLDPWGTEAQGTEGACPRSQSRKVVDSPDAKILTTFCLHVVCSCPTHSDLKDCSPPGSSILGILQARILEWVAVSSSRGSSQPRD